MFQVQETTKLFNHRGAVVRTDTRVVFETSDVVAATQYRWANAKGGYMVRMDKDHSVTLETLRDGALFGFAEAFRLVEGEQAYQAVMDEQAPPQSEEQWIASKAAGMVNNKGMIR